MVGSLPLHGAWSAPTRVGKSTRQVDAEAALLSPIRAGALRAPRGGRLPTVIPTPQGLYKKCTFSAEGLDLDASGGSGRSGSGRVPGGPGRFWEVPCPEV